MDLIEILGDMVVLRVHVQPGARRSGVVGRHGDALKVAVSAPPDAGRANDAVLGLVADLLGVRRSAVRLLAGRTSRTKRIGVEGVPAAVIAEVVGNAIASPGIARRQR